jgi:hypothetical protein
MKGKLFFSSQAEIDAANAAKKAATLAKNAPKAKILEDQVLRPSAKDIKTGQVERAAEGIKYMADMPKKATFEGASESVTGQIKPLQDALDVRLKADTLSYPSSSPNFKGDSANYIRAALGDMQNVYMKTRDAESARRMAGLIDQFDNGGLSASEINDIAREYGTTFRNKAFKASGEPSTSWMGEGYENTRIGVKNAARDIIVDPVARQIDDATSKLYALRSFFDDSAAEIRSLKSKTLPEGALQKLGNLVGKGVKLVGKKSGITNVLHEILPTLIPDGSSISAMEMENQLGKTLMDIRNLRGYDGTELVDEIVKIATENAAKQTAANASMKALPEGTIRMGTGSGQSGAGPFAEGFNGFKSPSVDKPGNLNALSSAERKAIGTIQSRFPLETVQDWLAAINTVRGQNPSFAKTLAGIAMKLHQASREDYTVFFDLLRGMK